MRSAPSPPARTSGTSRRSSVSALVPSRCPTARRASGATASSGGVHCRCPAARRSARPGTRRWCNAWRGAGRRGAVQGRPRPARADHLDPPDPARRTHLRVLLRGPVAHGPPGRRLRARVQGAGVGCCIKHYACNDQEHERMTISAEVSDPRAPRDPPRRLRGRRARGRRLVGDDRLQQGQRDLLRRAPDLINGVLRDEWGFDGLVMSDWFGTHSTAPAASPASTSKCRAPRPGSARPWPLPCATGSSTSPWSMARSGMCCV